MSSSLSLGSQMDYIYTKPRATFNEMHHIKPRAHSHKSNFALGLTNRTLAVHERANSRLLVLPGSESTINEITECIYFSPLKACREFKYKSEYNTVPVDLIIEPILFL